MLGKDIKKKAEEVHNNKYDLSEISDNDTILLKNRIRVRCNSCNNIVEPTVYNFLSGHGCKYCASMSRSEKLRDSKEDFITKSISKYGNTRFDYSSVDYKNSRTPVNIICNNCGESFLIRPSLFLSKSKSPCPTCRNTERIENFFKKAKALHGNKYDYSDTKYTGNRNKIKLRCNICGTIFFTNAASHIYPNKEGCKNLGGCPTCYLNSQRLTSEEFVEKLEAKYPGKFLLNSEYINSHTPVLLTCICCNNIFDARPNDILSGYGCPICAKKKNSLGEYVIENWLIENNINYVSQYCLPDLFEGHKIFVDFLISGPDNKIYIVEYNGEQHYRYHSSTNSIIFGRSEDEYKYQLRRDSNIREVVYKLGYVFLEIPYTVRPNTIGSLLEDIIILGTKTERDIKLPKVEII